MKLKLRLDELAVDSFYSDPTPAERGTVRGHETEANTACGGMCLYYTDALTCPHTCKNTCEATCGVKDTCYDTCDGVRFTCGAYCVGGGTGGGGGGGDSADCSGADPMWCGNYTAGADTVIV